MQVRAGDPLIRIRLFGLRHDIPVRELQLTPSASDGAVLSAVATYLQIQLRVLADAVVVRELPGHLTIRRRPAFGLGQ